MTARVQSKLEPIWTNREVEQFWAILEPYIRQLISDEIPTLLDDFQFLKEEITGTNYNRKIFYRSIHENMWRGKYSSAVANLKAFRRFSELNSCCHVSALRNNKNETSDVVLQELKKIFLERPLMK